MALWTPSQISTALWLDAADASTLYDATSGGSLVAADGTVARWQDKSGNARHATQATSINRPLRKTSVQNSLDGILFDGTNDDLTGTINLNTRDCSVFCVFLRTNAAGRTEIVVSSGDDTTTGDGSTIIPRWTDNNCYSSAGYLANRPVISSSIGTSATLLAVTGGLNQTVYKDGSAFGSPGSNQSATAVTRTKSYIGSGRGVSSLNRYFAGHICETIWVDSVVDSTTRQQIEGYLAWKWGIQANLPSGHLYKNAAPTAPGYKYPSLRTTAPVAGYYARLDAGADATDQFTADGSQDGTLTNGASRAGSPLAYSFDGTNDYVEFSSSAILGGSGSITITSWANATSLPLAANVIFSKMHTEGGTNQVAYLIAVLSNGRIYFATTNGGSGGVQEWQSSSTVISTGVWFHIAVTYTWGTGSTMQVYLNGSLVAGSWTTGNGNVTFTGASGPKQKIGRMQHTGVASFFSWTGLIDDLLVWNAIIDAANIGYLASQRGAIYALAAAGGGPINSQSLIRPADSKPYQQLIGV